MGKPSRMDIIMNKQRVITLAAVCGVIAMYPTIVLLCHKLSLGVTECTYLLQTHSSNTDTVLGVSFASYSLLRLYRKNGLYKTHLIFTGIATFLTGMASFVTHQVITTYHMPVFYFTLVTVWLSLSSTNQFRRSWAGWSLATAFLIGVMIFAYQHWPVIITLLCAMFSSGVALYHIGVLRLVEYGGYTGIATVFVLIGIMAYVAVTEMGMPSEGYEVLILFEALFRSAQHTDGIMVVAASLIGFVPFVYLAIKDSRRYKSPNADQ